MALSDAYEYRPITAAILPDVATLFRQVVHKRVTPRYLSDKYVTPWGNGKMWGFVAYSVATAQPVAVAAALPCRVVAGTQLIPAAQTMDTLTHPDHTGRGLMTHLLRLTVAELKTYGTELFFGFCNENSEHGYVKKLGWRVLLKMECYLLPGAPWPLEAVFRRSRLAFGWRFIAEKILEKYRSNTFWLPHSLLEEGYAAMLHDAAYFGYKHFSFNQVVNVAGTPIWLKADGGLLVGDLAVTADTDFDAVLAGLQRLARRLGLRRVVFQVSPGTRLQAALAQRLTPRGSWTVVGDAGNSDLSLERLRFGYGDLDTF